MSTSELPLCPICCDTLGCHGGPATLPCGHNGCLNCLVSVQSRNAHCPLCRAPFDPSRQLVPNHELRDLIAMATSMFMDGESKQDGWEAFPTAKLTAEHYASELKQERTEGKGDSGGSPSAPMLHQGGGPGTAVALQEGDKDLLALEPPKWLPDSYASQCGACHQPFRAVLRLRHHCRMCGKIFCHGCCHKRVLLPPKYGQREPQRTCEMCATMLAPLQPFLAGTEARAVQPPVHDAVDSVSLRSWVNSPWTSALDEDIYKAANMLQTFSTARRLEREKTLPASVLAGARGLVMLSMAKLSAGWSAAAGTGLMVARQESGAWSAPCAVACYAVGWGLQVGGELTDLLLVLRTDEALRAFCGTVNMGVGGNVGAAVGAVGRSAEASMRLGDGGRSGPVYSYSCSKGAFIGVSIEGTLVKVRDEVNLNFYGFPVTAKQLLLSGSSVPQPPAASLLYHALHTLMEKFEGPQHAQRQQFLQQQQQQQRQLPQQEQEPQREHRPEQQQQLQEQQAEDEDSAPQWEDPLPPNLWDLDVESLPWEAPEAPSFGFGRRQARVAIMEDG